VIMGSTPTTRGNNVWQIEDGNDFLQGLGPGGAVKFWIDANGALQPANITPGGALTSRNIYVDNGHSDSCVPDGSILWPFTTITAAVNKVAANGQTVNSDGVVMTPYVIYVAAGVYPETIDLSNPALRSLIFVGYGAIIGGPIVGGIFTVVQAINNDNLTDVNFIGFDFYPGTGPTHSYNFSSTTNGTNFGNGVNGFGITFTDCVLHAGGGDFYVNNCGQITWDRCVISSVVNVTNCILAAIKGGVSSINQGSQFNAFTTATPSPVGFASTQISLQAAQCLATISIDANSSGRASNGSAIRGNVTVNGNFTNRTSVVQGNITVNSGGTYSEGGGGGHTGSLTINAGGAYTQTGTYGIGNLFLNGAQLSTGVGSPQNVVTGNPGDLYLNKSGGSTTTLFVKESGTNTNTGWVGK
jgi:hypothetical protein